MLCHPHPVSVFAKLFVHTTVTAHALSTHTHMSIWTRCTAGIRYYTSLLHVQKDACLACSIVCRVLIQLLLLKYIHTYELGVSVLCLEISSREGKVKVSKNNGGKPS